MSQATRYGLGDMTKRRQPCPRDREMLRERNVVDLYYIMCKRRQAGAHIIAQQYHMSVCEYIIHLSLPNAHIPFYI